MTHDLFGHVWMRAADVADVLRERHYLGPISRGRAYADEFGVMVLGKPTSRRLPQDGSWFELSRWCLFGVPNGGSRQWARVVKLLRADPTITTVVSYSDPSVGHTGALYRACNWLWAPTWHRLRPPPSGHGTWDGSRQESVKDRWVFELRRDPRRVDLLTINDESLLRKRAELRYREGCGVRYERIVA